MLRVKILAAKSLNKIKEFIKAEKLCDEVTTFIQEFIDSNEVYPFFKFALKAHYIRAKNLQ